MDIRTDELLLAKAYHWEATTPDRIFLTQPTGGGEAVDYTWRETMTEARKVAAHLRSLNFPPKSQIALMGKNSAHWIITDLGIWMAGHVTVPLYPTLAANTVRQILEHSESKILFVGKLDDWEQMKAGVPDGMAMISLPLAPPESGIEWEKISGETEPIADNPHREPDEMATIVYTSGTTGEPKGVMLTFGAMGTACREFATILDFSRNGDGSAKDRVISYLPLAHVYERVAIESNSIYNAIHIFFAESLQTFVQDLQRARPTIFQSVPRLYLKFQAGVFAKMPKEKLERLLKIPLLGWLVRRKVLKGLGLDQCRMAICGAAPVPVEVLEWYRGLGLELLEAYGMTENCAYSHLPPPGKVRVGYVGVSNPGVETRISEEGEVQVKSPGTMKGYFKLPELTAESFTEDGFLKTGDMGEIDQDGYLRITGRIKELFKTSKGKYVAPAPIENQLISNPYIEQACVTGPEFPQPFALVMLSEEVRGLAADGEGRGTIQSELETLIEQVNQDLDPHERLAFLAVVKDQWEIENGMITPTMKIKRHVIEKTYSPNFQGWADAKAPVVWQ
ncbi:MAG: AMP-binding protein [SAR324 cluster bacterium]|nr:AMP-binding protein [SAR324 cluster bacterium]